MAVQRLGLELVFNLQWRDKSENAVEKANLIGMYDTPTTTLNLETFKSYLLKNSGVASNDLKINYIIDNGSEWSIDSQNDFEIALSAFRLKARLGEIIFLNLNSMNKNAGKINDKKVSSDVETQYDDDDDEFQPPQWFTNYMKQFKNEMIEEIEVKILNKKTESQNDPNPTTFQLPVSENKKHKRESSKRSCKHLFSEGCLIDKERSKEFLKTSKHDRKSDNKFDRMDHKVKKIKDKKIALIHKNLELFQMKNGHEEQPVQQQIDISTLMNAKDIQETSLIPHVLAGAKYFHKWEVINNGKLPWTENTELRLTWGSVDMKPALKIIPAPKLKPNDSGFISITFNMPDAPGQYESYWNFYDNNVRFGQYLSFVAIVDSPIQNTFNHNNSNSPIPCSSTSYLNAFYDTNDDPLLFEKKRASLKETEKQLNAAAKLLQSHLIAEKQNQNVNNKENVHSQKLLKHEIKQEEKTHSCHSDIQNLVSVSTCVETNESHNKNNEYVMVCGKPMRLTEEDEQELSIELPEIFDDAKSNDENEDNLIEKKLSILKIDEDDKNNNDQISSASSESILNLSMATPPELNNAESEIFEEQDNDYILVSIKGNKLALPKKILHPDFVAERTSFSSASTSTSTSTQTQKIKMERNNENIEVVNDVQEKLSVTTEKENENLSECNMESYLSHCSAAGSSFSDMNETLKEELQKSKTRFFIFPQSTPGFEVHYPNSSQNYNDGETILNYSWQNSATKYAQSFVNNFEANNAVPNFQQQQQNILPSAPQEQQIPEHLNQTQENLNAYIAQQEYQQQQQPQPQPSPPLPKSQNNNNMLPETLVLGAVNVASSAINTARSVFNMITPPAGSWIGGHWVPNANNLSSERQQNLNILREMGFLNQDLNATLLARYNDDMDKVTSELLNQ